MRLIVFLALLPLFFCSGISDADSIKARVLSVLPEASSIEVEVLESESEAFSLGDTQFFQVGPGDLGINYKGRTVRANVSYFGNDRHLEQLFPVDGEGAKAARDVNRRLHQITASMSRRKYIKTGMYIPNFALIDQQGSFLQIRQLRGKPFILNFIFTRCRVAHMCPASSIRMAQLQDMAAEKGLETLQFVSITFDPVFDSPGILKQYAEGYGMEAENFHLLTGEPTVIDDILRQFGILTMEEDGTINHTMATLLVDAKGRVFFRREGSDWTVNEFWKAANQLLNE